jgi:hypothetical protein
LIQTKVSFSGYKTERSEHEEGSIHGGADHCGIAGGGEWNSCERACRRAGISTVTFYKWKTKYAGMEISEVHRMRLLEDENARLKKIVANL